MIYNYLKCTKMRLLHSIIHLNYNYSSTFDKVKPFFLFFSFFFSFYYFFYFLNNKVASQHIRNYMYLQHLQISVAKSIDYKTFWFDIDYFISVFQPVHFL